jgi:phosphate-selective porin OprO/OprP
MTLPQAAVPWARRRASAAGTKNYLALMVGLLLLPRMASGAPRDICQMLKDKGLLTEIEFNECKAAQEGEEDRWTRNLQDFVKNWIQYKEGTGFIINSAATAPQDYMNPTPKPRFSFALGNRIQLRYTYLSPDTVAEDDQSAFRVRRLKTFISGNAFYPWLKYKVQVNWVGFNEPDTRSNEPDLEDAIIDVAYFPFAALQGGQYKVPFDRQELTSSGAQQFVDRAITNARFTFARDQGVMLHGLIGREKKEWLEYSAGVFNGNGRNKSTNDNFEHLGVGRLYFTPMGPFKYSESDTDNTPRPMVAIGTAYAYNPVTGTSTVTRPVLTEGEEPVATGATRSITTTTDADIHRFTADAHFKWRGLSALADYLYELRDDKTPQVTEIIIGADGRAGAPTYSQRSPALTTGTHGFLVQAGYFILPRHLELAGRYAMFNPEGTDNRQEEARGAINYFFFAHNLKLQADFGAVTRQVPAAEDRSDFEARLQAQLIF